MKSYLISLLSLAVQAKDNCNALVLSGGGSNGAWEVGVMWGLSHNAINPEDFAWDYVTGISAGSINTSVISGFAPGHEKQMSEFLSQAFNEVANENVY